MDRNLTLACILVAAVFSSTFSPVSIAAVLGTVTDMDGDPVSGATVTYIDESNMNIQFRGTTDGRGWYEVDLDVTGVQETSPVPFSLGQNYPNPFNPATTIPFTLDTAGHVELSIYSITGQIIVLLINAELGAGDHALRWNGTDDRGNHVGAGVYLYRLIAGTRSATGKMVLLDGGADTGGSLSIPFPGIVADTRIASRIASIFTCTVTITHDDIIPYEETGVVVRSGYVRDFIVNRKGSDLPDELIFVHIPEVTEPYLMNPDDFDEFLFSVTLPAFEMSTTEITNLQYAKYLHEVLESGDIAVSDSIVTGAGSDWNGKEYLDLTIGQISYTDGGFVIDTGKEKRPVAGITWYGAKAFARYYGYDLPTEAEWQYAASGGMNYEYGTDDGTLDSTKANYVANRRNHTMDVGMYPANPFGLYDMVGNLYEWCHDWFWSYPVGTKNIYSGSDFGSERVIRSGHSSMPTNSCRVDFRNSLAPDYCSGSVGFRVVRRQDGETN